MSFKTSEKHEQFRKEVRAFAEQEIKPIAFKLDQEDIFPTEIVKKMAERGWMGLPFEKEYGGAGLDNQYYSICVEELSRVDAGCGVIVSAHTSLGTWPIYNFGTEEQKKKYLIPLAKGEHIGAFGLTEQHAGSDAGGTETTAVLDGDHYVLNGSKIFITNGSKADTYVIFAVTSPEKGTHGISAFIVEAGWEGFTYPTVYNKLGIRSSVTAELNFKNVIVPKENLLGEEGQGFAIAMATLDGGRIGMASQAVGIAEGAIDLAVAYAKERVQFKKPISANQGIQWYFADIATSTEAAKMLTLQAADLRQRGQNIGKLAAMAKYYASENAVTVTNKALQIHGGYGYMKEYAIERMYRDARITTLYEGTSEVQKMVISRAVLS